MILQLHKMNVELEESKHKQQEHAETIKNMKMKNGNLWNEIDDLKKVKERLAEQSQFLEKSLRQKMTENNELLQRLKQAEIQLGESGSVLDTVRNLESKNEVLSAKMSSVVLNSEEEIVKARNERDHYLRLFEGANSVNKRNVEIQKRLEVVEEVSKRHAERAKAVVEKFEKAHSEITKNLEELLRAKEKYLRFERTREGLEAKAKNNSEANEVLERENKDLGKKVKELETRNGNLERFLKEQRKACHSLNEQLAKTKREKEELYRDVYLLRKKTESLRYSQWVIVFVKFSSTSFTQVESGTRAPFTLVS